MKGKAIFLDELRPATKSYKVKVKVVDKGRPKTSPKKLVKYQNLIIKDDKGNKMKGTLFGEQVEGYKDALQYNGVYEIANAPIQECSGQWKTSEDELDYQMSFGRQTIIQPIEAEMGAVLPEYCCIANIPRAADGDEKFDVIGVLLYVDPEARKVPTSKAYDTFVREIVIADHSTEMPLVISAWNDLAMNDCNALSALANSFTVVAFTALRVSAHKGFSLSTTMSTTFIQSPTGERAEALTGWALRHQDALANRQGRVFAARDSSQECLLTTIAALRVKKAANVLPEDRFRLKVRVPICDLEKVYAYVGCSRCSRRSELPLDTVFDCNGCLKKECVSSHRVTFNCEITDDSGSLSVTMFTKECEALFKMPSAEIVHMKQSDDQETFGKVQRLLKTPTVVEVGPTPALAKNSILQWVPKKVVSEESVLQDENLIHPTVSAKSPKDCIVPSTPPKHPAQGLTTVDHGTSSKCIANAKEHPKSLNTTKGSVAAALPDVSNKSGDPTGSSNSGSA